MVVGSVLLIVAAIVLLAYGLIQGSNASFVASIAASLMAAVALIASGRQAWAFRSEQREQDHRGAESVTPPTDLHEQLAPVPDPGRAEASDVRAAGAGQTALLTPVRDHLAGAHPAGARAGRVSTDQVVPAQGSRPEVARSGAAVGAPKFGGPPVEDIGADETGSKDAGSKDAGGKDAGVEVIGSSVADGEYGPDDRDPPDEPPAQRTTPAQAALVARLSTPVLVVDGRPRYHQANCVHLVDRPTEPLPVNEAIELGFTPCGQCAPDTALAADASRV